MTTTADPCRDCLAPVGTEHDNGCDVARCLATGLQRLTCELTRHDGEDIDHADCGRDVWTGEWPGVADCQRLGWYSRWRTDRPGWERCGPDDEGATEDLNRLGQCGRWDPESRRWEART